MRFRDFYEGKSFFTKRVITTAMVDSFAELTGDKNPVHTDEEFAKNTRFGRRIAHGMLSVGIISAILGNDFPGPGSIYMRQEVKFLKPIFLEEEVKITIEILEKNEEKRDYWFVQLSRRAMERRQLTAKHCCSSLENETSHQRH